MRHSIGRRDFLRKCSATTSLVGAAVCSPNLIMGIEPVIRNGSTKFKFSMAAYSYNRLLKGSSPELTLFDFVEDCADMNLDATELTSYYFPPYVTDGYLRELKQYCFRMGLDISGTAVGNDFGFPRGPEREQQIASVKEWIEHAEVIGAPVIRIFAGKRKPGLSKAESHRLMVEGIEECCDHARQHGVYLALENHGGPTATAEGMMAFIRDVRSPWFGVNLDTGNFFCKDPYRELEQIAPYALNVQVKVMITNDADKRTKVATDFKRLARILGEVNYRGYIALEYEEDGDPRIECPKHIQEMRSAFTG